MHHPHRSKGLTTKFGGPCISKLRCPITLKLLFGAGDNKPQLSVRTVYDDAGQEIRKQVEYHYMTAC